jgi:hypothetical protein
MRYPPPLSVPARPGLPREGSGRRGQEFLAELAVDIGIPISKLVQVQKGGNRLQQGTWVHRRFAGLVAGWAEELFTQGRVDLRPASPRRQPR